MQPRGIGEYQIGEEGEALRLYEQRTQLADPCPAQFQRPEDVECDGGMIIAVRRRRQRMAVIHEITLAERGDNDAPAVCRIT